MSILYGRMLEFKLILDDCKNTLFRWIAQCNDIHIICRLYCSESNLPSRYP